MTAKPDPIASPPRLDRSWICLAIAMAWVALMRVPLVLNVGTHLDSDLAVDGLTLLDAVNGHWRWHYPATPFIGATPVAFSWLQAMIFGANPFTLVSAGVVIYELIVVSTFVLNRRAFGPSVASWGLIPLACASTGTIWLSGRVTGGHLMAAAWHAGAFAIFAGLLKNGGWRRSAWLGLWCGMGLWVDTMFAVTWAGLGLAVVVFWWSLRASANPRRVLSILGCLLAFVLAAGVGISPRIIGQKVDPYDGYVGQFNPSIRSDLLVRNSRFLLLDCLPRLIAGHRLPGLHTEPDPSALTGGERASEPEGTPWLALSVTGVALFLYFRSAFSLMAKAEGDPVSRAVRWGLLTSSLAVITGFMISTNISNSDNYRYLVFLIVPWSSSFGLMMHRSALKKPTGLWVTGAVALGFAILMTVDTARWYARFGWIDEVGRPIRKAVDDPALEWLQAHPEVTSVFGGYWDVYRLSFLTGGRVKGVPFPGAPDRFPEIKEAMPGHRPRIVIIRPKGPGPRYRAAAMMEGATEVGRAEGLSIIDWPVRGTP